MSEIEKQYEGMSLIPCDEDFIEFKNIIKEIADNPSVLALKEHIQHNSGSRYAHCMEVSYYTYKICKKWNLDYKSAARGEMLHDFYFYNWRNKGVEGQKKFHLMRHPRIALTNAMELFELNDLEKDLILKHMWPVNPFLPKYKEGYIVTFVDKYCATKEFFNRFKIKKQIRKAQAKKAKETLDNIEKALKELD